MEQPIIIVTADEPETPSADFAAGAATVLAAAAGEVATDAAQTAAAAHNEAEQALTAAVDAELTADQAHARLDRIETFLEDLVDAIDPTAAGQLPDAPDTGTLADDGAPPPVDTPVVEPTTAEKKTKRARSGRWGSDGWFGSRE
jgi:hypothetical protein